MEKMHRRRNSGASTKSNSTMHSSHVRSLVDSPGSSSGSGSNSEDGHSLGLELEMDDYTHRSQVSEGTGTSASSAYNNEYAHGDEAITLPLHKQHGNVTFSSGNSGGHQMSLVHQHQAGSVIGSGSGSSSGGGMSSNRQRYQNTIEKAAGNMKRALSSKLSHKSQKENKTPENQYMYGSTISRQSTFESTSSYQSDHPDASVRSTSNGSRVSLMDIDEQSRQSSTSAVPLVLGSGTSSTSTSSYFTSNNNNHHHAVIRQENEQGNGNGNALILTNEKRGETRNPMFKNLLSTVQLPRPRLLPFSPMAQSAHTNTPTTPQSPGITAASFAKQAPKAGYLRKLGNSVVEYKQRFFVLKPTTCLYYFLSPNDDEPRGCIDLDGFVDSSDTTGMGGMKVNSLGTLPDGRFRFECVLPIQNEDRDGPQSRKILLEARNEEIGKGWMQALTVERLSFSKATGELLKDQVRELEVNVKDLEDQVDEFRLVEKDRDGAIEDAKAWSERAEKLDHALNSLKQWLSRPTNSSTCSTEPTKDSSRSDGADGVDGVDDDDCSQEEKSSNEYTNTSLSISKEDKALDEIDLPGTNFSSLVNACRGLKENLRLTSIETNTALDDLQDSNQKTKTLQEKVNKAEKYICKLWEENCSARESLKQRKNEKKILVNEVKSLMEKASASEIEIDRLKKEKKELEEKCRELGAANQRNAQDRGRESDHTSRLGNERSGRKCQLKTPEKRLLLELEEHVNTSLFQHEHLLNDSIEIESPPRVNTTSNSDLRVLTAKKSNKSVDLSRIQNLPHKDFEAREGESTSEDDTSDDSEKTDVEAEDRPRTYSPLLPKNLSLMDQVALEEASEKTTEEANGGEGVLLRAILNSPSSLSLTSANLEVFEEEIWKGKKDELLNAATPKTCCSDEEDEPIRNPLDALDADASVSGPSDHSLKSLVTDNGKATSKLTCPLTDVTQSTPTSDHSQIYSLTFYTQRIGLQFQKVPSNLKQSGLLTEAMTADFGEKRSEDATASSRTEAELRLIASLSSPSQASKAQDPIKNQSCPVLLPKHFVLVCGFQGFDEASSNRRPSLGARLVGFDGMSIERGPWTFEAVRKAIKARGRPLTLTFRDDYLTTDQRLVLTKAANDVELSSKNQPPRPTSRPMNVPGTINAVTKSGDRMTKSPSFSDISRDLQSQDDSTTLSTCSRSSDNWRTFSDAGSASVNSSRFSPLMANLLSGIPSTGERKKAQSPFTPEYFRRSNDSLDSASHQEFKASLL